MNRRDALRALLVAPLVPLIPRLAKLSEPKSASPWDHAVQPWERQYMDALPVMTTAGAGTTVTYYLKQQTYTTSDGVTWEFVGGFGETIPHTR